MIEVEVKARPKDFNSIKQRLNRIGAKFVRNEKQTDRIFGNDMFLDDEHKVIEGGILARIRSINNNKTLEFKEVVRRGGGIEIKSNLADINMGLNLLRKLKFDEAFSVSKLREKYSHKDLTICLDSVTGLGRFIEIEKMIENDGDKDRARRECLDLLKLLAPDSEIEERKYGDLIQEQINKRNS
jgi:adenylate cyclase class 2